MNNDLNNNNGFDGQELRVRGDWDEVKGKLRQQYGNLTDDDLEYTEGKQEEWFGQLSQKVGHTVDDIKAWFKSL